MSREKKMPQWGSPLFGDEPTSPVALAPFNAFVQEQWGRCMLESLNQKVA